MANNNLNQLDSLVRVEEIEDIVDQILQNLGVAFHLSGYDYMRDAIILVLSHEDEMLIKQIYALVAMMRKTSFTRVERNIRHCIQESYKKAGNQAYQSYFGKFCDKCPSNSEFIYTVARFAIKAYRKG